MTFEDRIQYLFERAVQLPMLERDVFLRAECKENPVLLSELNSLLAADEDARQNTSWSHSALQNEARLTSETLQAEIGDVIGPYRIVELLGNGGMGAVYRAVRVDAEYEKSVAIKKVNVGVSSRDAITRFRAERQILAALEHPNIARLLDGGVDRNGSPYFVMEYVEGIPPLDFSEAHDLSLFARLTLFRRICDAVHYAHQRLVIHRDLKPGNILVTADGVPKLLDFGIAKVLKPDFVPVEQAVTEAGASMLTARYASPEQIRGEPVTTASDIYSLGVVLYELVTGQSPYGDLKRPAHELMVVVCQEDPPKPSSWARSLRGDLDNIILKALKKDPESRYSSVAAFAEDIGRFTAGFPVHARANSALYVAGKFIRRNAIGVAAAALVVCTLVFALVVVNRARGRADRRFNEVRQLAHAVVFDYHDAIERLPGSTAVRARLVQDALHYLDSLAEEADTPELKREIVEAYIRISNVQGNAYNNNLGDVDGALGTSRKAVAEAEKLLRQDYTAQSTKTAAVAHSTYGSLLYSAGHLNDADREYRRALLLMRFAVQKNPADIDAGIAISEDLRHLGDLYGGYSYQNLGKTQESAEFYLQSADVIQKLLTRFPNDLRLQKQHYDALLSLSALENSLGQKENAERHLKTALEEIATVSKADPNDSNVQVEMGNAQVRLGGIFLDNGDLPRALDHISRAAVTLKALIATDPKNSMYRRGLSVVESQLANALRIAGDAHAALPHNLQALALSEQLSQASPSSTEFRSDIGVAERKLSDTMLAAGDITNALRRAERSRQILCIDLHAADAYLQANCGRAALAVGNAQERRGDLPSAIRSYRQAAELAGSLQRTNPANKIYLSDLGRAESALAIALEHAGDLQEAVNKYRAALNDWAQLRNSKALSAEDGRRAQAAANGLASLRKTDSRP